MTVRHLFDKVKKFEIDLYKKPPDFTVNHVAFTGAPEKHPHDKGKIILFVDPFSTYISYYEFSVADIAGVEDLPNLVNLQGKTVKMYRVWVRKGSFGIRSTPFIVEDTSKARNY